MAETATVKRAYYVVSGTYFDGRPFSVNPPYEDEARARRMASSLRLIKTVKSVQVQEVRR